MWAATHFTSFCVFAQGSDSPSASWAAMDRTVASPPGRLQDGMAVSSTTTSPAAARLPSRADAQALVRVLALGSGRRLVRGPSPAPPCLCVNPLAAVALCTAVANRPDRPACAGRLPRRGALRPRDGDVGQGRDQDDGRVPPQVLQGGERAEPGDPGHLQVCDRSRRTQVRAVERASEQLEQLSPVVGLRGRAAIRLQGRGDQGSHFVVVVVRDEDCASFGEDSMSTFTSPWADSCGRAPSACCRRVRGHACKNGSLGPRQLSQRRPSALARGVADSGGEGGALSRSWDATPPDVRPPYVRASRRLRTWRLLASLSVASWVTISSSGRQINASGGSSASRRARHGLRDGRVPRRLLGSYLQDAVERSVRVNSGSGARGGGPWCCFAGVAFIVESPSVLRRDRGRSGRKHKKANPVLHAKERARGAGATGFEIAQLPPGCQDPGVVTGFESSARGAATRLTRRRARRASFAIPCRLPPRPPKPRPRAPPASRSIRRLPAAGCPPPRAPSSRDGLQVPTPAAISAAATPRPAPRSSSCTRAIVSSSTTMTIGLTSPALARLSTAAIAAPAAFAHASNTGQVPHPLRTRMRSALPSAHGGTRGRAVSYRLEEGV